MSRCPATGRPHQFSGRAKYWLASKVMQCILEAGHAGPCAMEPIGDRKQETYFAWLPTRQERERQRREEARVAKAQDELKRWKEEQERTRLARAFGRYR